MRSIMLAIAVLIPSATISPVFTAQTAASDDCGSTNILKRFPVLPLPLRIDERRWKSDDSVPSVPLSKGFVDSCLQQDPAYGRFFPVGRLPVPGGTTALIPLIVRFSGPEDGYNDVYYLFTLDPRGRLRSSLAMAVFNGGAIYSTSSEATVTSLQDIKVRVTYSERADADPAKVVRETVNKSCYMINWNGLPIIEACP